MESPLKKKEIARAFGRNRQSSEKDGHGRRLSDVSDIDAGSASISRCVAAPEDYLVRVSRGRGSIEGRDDFKSREKTGSLRIGPSVRYFAFFPPRTLPDRRRKRAAECIRPEEGKREARQKKPAKRHFKAADRQASSETTRRPSSALRLLAFAAERIPFSFFTFIPRFFSFLVFLLLLILALFLFLIFLSSSLLLVAPFADATFLHFF